MERDGEMSIDFLATDPPPFSTAPQRTPRSGGGEFDRLYQP